MGGRLEVVRVHFTQAARRAAVDQAAPDAASGPWQDMVAASGRRGLDGGHVPLRTCRQKPTPTYSFLRRGRSGNQRYPSTVPSFHSGVNVADGVL